MRQLAILAIGAMTLAGCQNASNTDPNLHVGVDRYNKPITTDNIHAQQWFDQGLQLTYGFHHAEAIRSYRMAIEVDPNCAMGWWGIGYALGPNINDPVLTPERHEEAYQAAQRAYELRSYASPKEAALIDALTTRYASPMPEDVTKLNRAFAREMRKVYERYPNDPDIGALFAESLMTMQPWDYWTAEKAPKGNTEEVVEVLEAVFEIDEDHPGALHFYIHAMESGPNPERAVPIGDRLVDRVPGSGHLRHMPSHIYAVVGRWADASDANERAIAADLATLANSTDEDFYWIYYGHNIHFLAYTAMMECRYDTAMRAARQLWRDMPDRIIREQGWICEGIVPTKYHVMIRFGRWEDILAEPAPPSHYLVSNAVHHYARSIAHSARGETYEARDELAKFDVAAAAIPEDWMQFNNKMNTVLPIARLMVEAELVYREGEYEKAYSMLRKAAKMEDKLVYDEPPAWMVPVRHALGALLMAQGRYTEAEQVYLEDLERNPHNGWALLGMKQSLKAQGRRDREAEDYAGQLAEAWKRADVQPESSCYCEPGTTYR